MAVPALIQAVPGIISAARGKDVHILPYPSGRPPRPGIPSDWLRPARGQGGRVAPRKAVAAADDDATDDEEKWMRGAVGLAGGITTEMVRAIMDRRKEFELA